MKMLGIRPGMSSGSKCCRPGKSPGAGRIECQYSNSFLVFGYHCASGAASEGCSGPLKTSSVIPGHCRAMPARIKPHIGERQFNALREALDRQLFLLQRGDRSAHGIVLAPGGELVEKTLPIPGRVSEFLLLGRGETE